VSVKTETVIGLQPPLTILKIGVEQFGGMAVGVERFNRGKAADHRGSRREGPRRPALDRPTDRLPPLIAQGQAVTAAVDKGAGAQTLARGCVGCPGPKPRLRADIALYYKPKSKSGCLPLAGRPRLPARLGDRAALNRWRCAMAATVETAAIPWWREPTKDQWYAYVAAWARVDPRRLRLHGLPANHRADCGRVSCAGT
jgi:hypothetical protein